MIHNGMASFKFEASQARSIHQYKQFWLYLNNIVLSWPEDGRLTAETRRQE